MRALTELIARKPWILIILGFLLLISVWVIFFILAAHNQPERLPIGLISQTEIPASTSTVAPVLS